MVSSKRADRLCITAEVDFSIRTRSQSKALHHFKADTPPPKVAGGPDQSMYMGYTVLLLQLFTS